MKFYRVQSGDTLASIAQKYNISLESLQRYNRNIESIAPGQTIMLPRGESIVNTPQDRTASKVIAVQTTTQPPTTTTVPTITPPGFTCPLLREGDTGTAVTVLQERLRDLGFNPGTISGTFNAATLRALTDFQKIMQDVSVTGTTTLETWAALGFSCGITVPSNFTCPEIAVNSTNPAVRLLETRLKVLGFDPGPIDGVFTAKTEEALKAFQISENLQATGRTNAVTWQNLGFVCVAPPTTTTAPTTTTVPPTTTTAPPATTTVPPTTAPPTTTTVPPTTTTAPPGFSCPLLARFHTGSAVIILQQRLKAMGFNPGPVDGIFGPRTEAALISFQRSRNIPVTGTTTLQTWCALGIDCALPPQPPGFTCPVLRRGSRGEDVRFLQIRLNAFGFNPGPIDGIFGPRTEAALNSFQRSRNLTNTGTTTQATWRALGVTCPTTTTPPPTTTTVPPTTTTPPPATTTAPPLPTAPPGFNCQLLRFGERNSNVEFLQRRLRAFGFNPGAIDGIFGSLTENALKEFQIAHGLPPTGTSTLETWERLNVTCTAPPTTTTPPPTPTPPPGFGCPLLRLGSVGDAVEFLQIKLRYLGFNPGPIDGIFGIITESALRQFQTARGLTVTGTTTTQTWNALGIICATPVPTTTAPPTEIESMWFYVDSPQAYSSLQENYSLIDVLIPFWYPITAAGDIIDNTNPTVLAFAKQRNIPVYGLIHNFSSASGRFEPEVIGTIIANPGLRARLIANILELLREKGLAGVNVDFEFIPPAQRNNFTLFMQELYQVLNAAGYTVTIDVAAKESDLPANPYSGAFDYSQLWSYADQVILLTQDEHYLGFDPGPIASIPWVESVVNYALSQGMPANKIKISIPVYGYDWELTQTGRDFTVSAPRAAELAQAYNIVPEFDPTAMVPHFEYIDQENEPHSVWYENAISFSAKLDLILEKDLAGFAAWRLGLEDPLVWEVLDTYI